MMIKRVTDPRSERLNDAARDNAAKARALIEYVAMMADVELPLDEEVTDDVQKD